MHISKSCYIFPPRPTLPKGDICHLPPLLSPPTFLKADQEPRAGHSASLFHCLLPGGRRRACLLIAQISPFFREAHRATFTGWGQGRSHAPLLISISGVERSRNFLRLTQIVFRRPSQMMNKTSFQISHPFSASVALDRQKIINTGRHERSLHTQNFTNKWTLSLLSGLFEGEENNTTNFCVVL